MKRKSKAFQRIRKELNNMSTDRNVTVIFSDINPMATSTGIERYNIKDMKIGDRIKAYCVPE